LFSRSTKQSWLRLAGVAFLCSVLAGCGGSGGNTSGGASNTGGGSGNTGGNGGSNPPPVTGTPVADPFHFVGGCLVHGFYDQSRQLLFASNPCLNELDVISGLDFSVKARVPVPQPWGIDQMADGNTLVIGTQAQEILTVNENTLAVTGHPYSAVSPGNFFSPFFPNVVAMANGKVLMIAAEQGIESNDILDGGQFIYEWDSNANTFKQFEPSAATQCPSCWETDSLARSADHKWAVFAGDQFYLYSSDTDSLMSAPFSAVDPPDDSFGVRGYAINADGSEIAVASAGQVTFLDNSMTVLATTPIPYAFQSGRTTVEFSPDDSKLYLQYDMPLAIEEIDAKSYIALGYLSGDAIPGDNLERLLATDSEGQAYVGIDSGLRLVDLTQPPVPNSDSNSLQVPGCPQLDAVLPLSQSQQQSLMNVPSDISIYVGGQPAPLLNSNTMITIPASSVAGPADIECIDSVGDTEVVPDSVSYGVEPLGLSANLLPPDSNPYAYLFGFGFYSGPDLSNTTESPFDGSLTLGGEPGLNPVILGSVGYQTLEGVAFKVPNGSPGESADASVTSTSGTGHLSSVATYYASPTIIPASGLMQLLYDPHRSVVYALKANEVDVLSASTLGWQSPLVFPTGFTAASSSSSMALSPDGSKLVVASLTIGAGGTATGAQLLMLDPDNVSPPSMVSFTAGEPTGSIAITNANTVIFAGYPPLAFNLSTSTVTSLSPPAPFFGMSAVRASADGSRVYAALYNTNTGSVYSIDPATNTVQSEGFGYMYWSDMAVSPDGSQFAAMSEAPGAAGDNDGFFDPALHYLNANAYPGLSPPDDVGVVGAAYSPGGKVLVVPLGDSIEFWNAAQGTLMGRLMTPEELQVITSPDGPAAPMMALDSSGQTIYAISASGVAVMTLPQPIDQMSNQQWAVFKPAVTTGSEFFGTITLRMKAMRRELKSGHRPRKQR